MGSKEFFDMVFWVAWGILMGVLLTKLAEAIVDLWDDNLKERKRRED